jgi:hypothetical protein
MVNPDIVQFSPGSSAERVIPAREPAEHTEAVLAYVEGPTYDGTAGG